jgi:hypothetical protein
MQKKMEKASSSERSVPIYQSAWCHIANDCNLNRLLTTVRNSHFMHFSNILWENFCPRIFNLNKELAIKFWGISMDSQTLSGLL